MARRLDNKPVSRYELRHVQPRESIDVAEFGSGIAPDLPVIRTGGEPIGDLNLPLAGGPGTEGLRQLADVVADDHAAAPAPGEVPPRQVDER